MPRRRPPEDIEKVERLKQSGLTDARVSAATGVPVTTIRAWRRRGHPAAPPVDDEPRCQACGEAPHDFGALPCEDYSYLLAVYLGDGHVVRNGSSWTLRVTLDRAYPAIVEECQRAVLAICGMVPSAIPSRRDRSVVVSKTWKAWACLFPQHGPGRKHLRPIVLADWQQRIVDQAPGRFLRGLIHTDGWRGVNKVCSKGRRYEYPRYQFSNRSDDIRRLFTNACEALGIEWRQWTRYHVSVARRESVALLDQFVGEKR
jgi:hypothetical protein